MEIDYANLKPDDNYLQALPCDVWLMDNHKWALSVWARQHKGKRWRLVHADHHWDGVDLFLGDTHAQSELLAAGLDELDRRVYEEDRIQYDAFIAPAVRRGLFEQVHFFCTQDDDYDKGIDPALCDAMGVVQVLHDSVATLSAIGTDAPIAFDLCLDLFNEATMFYESELWADEAIVEFLTSVGQLVKAADVVTVSLSFGYSGTEDDTRRLAALVVPKLLAQRSASSTAAMVARARPIGQR